MDFELYDRVWWCYRPGKPNAKDYPSILSHWLGITQRVGSYICYCFITETDKLVSKASVEHLTRNAYLNPDIKSSINDFNNKLTGWLDNINFQLITSLFSEINSDVDGKFDFVLPDEDFRKI